MNRGAQELQREIREAGSQARLSGLTGLDQGYLSRLARGERTAGLHARQLLREHCGIELQAWDEPPAPETISQAPDAKGAA